MKGFLPTIEGKFKTLKAKAKQLPFLRPLNYNKVFGEVRWRPDSDQPEVVKFTVSIHSLPPEVLAECFHWYIISIHRAHISPERYKSEGSLSRAPSPYSWIAIRHVCRWWREIALTFPVLSTYICITSTACVQDMLSRAGQLPIHVYESAGPTILARREPRTLVLERLPRIASLHLRCPDPTPPTGRISLREIMLRLVRGQHLMQMWGYPELSISAVQQSHNFTRLTDFSCSFGELILVGAEERILGANLRRIYLHRCVHPTTHPMKFFMDMLNRLVQLEELVLDHAFHMQTPAQTAPRWPIDTSSLPQVSLPNLQSLNIQDDDFITAHIIVERITFPTTASVSFNFSNIPDTALHIAGAFVSCLNNAQPTTNQSDLVPQSVSIARQSATDIELLFWRDRLSLQQIRERQKGGEGACFEFRCPSVDSAFARALLAHAPLHAVKAALLVEQVAFGSFPWNSVLCSLTAVDELGLEYETAPEIEEPSSQRSSGLAIVYAPLATVQYAHVWLHRPSAVEPSVDCHRTSMLHNAAQTLSAQHGIICQTVELPHSGDTDEESKDLSVLEIMSGSTILGLPAPSVPERPKRGLRGWFASSARAFCMRSGVRALHDTKPPHCEP